LGICDWNKPYREFLPENTVALISSITYPELFTSCEFLKINLSNLFDSLVAKLKIPLGTKS